MKNQKFLIDHRKNPKLHLYYVKCAVYELALIDRAIEKFRDQARTSLAGIICALFSEIEKLVKEDAAYYDADQMIKLASGSMNIFDIE